ncbi:hypothetical protein HPB47_008305 [Ixodes persulcatus]|uniref:Uncharacterized protein n=1 Tax=Ixodes persulcatus TaxID=34615 RepID=A0AC60P5X6_IXOPE|nr:hypothetical protein HPB47_008305 [Ixodes persulcatus]
MTSSDGNRGTAFDDVANTPVGDAAPLFSPERYEGASSNLIPRLRLRTGLCRARQKRTTPLHSGAAAASIPRRSLAPGPDDNHNDPDCIFFRLEAASPPPPSVTGFDPPPIAAALGQKPREGDDPGPQT